MLPVDKNYIQKDKKLADNKYLAEIIYAKSILSFGYRQYILYYYKRLIYKCFGQQNKTSMTSRKYQRAKNAEAKMAEEMDLITILKTLRSARFLIDFKMSV